MAKDIHGREIPGSSPVTPGKPPGYDQWSASDQREYDKLNEQFSSEFWDPGNYFFDPAAGGEGGAAVLAAYKDFIASDPDRSIGRQEALKNMLDFLDRRGNTDEIQAGKQIDFSPIFDKFGGTIDQTAAASLRVNDLTQANALGQINRGATGAADRASEALAGTGLGRSGAAASKFQGIETTRQNLDASVIAQTDVRAAQIEQGRVDAQRQLAFNRGKVEMSEMLHERGWLEEDRRIAEAYYNMLGAMQFEYNLNQEDDDWLDYVAAAADVVDAFVPG